MTHKMLKEERALRRYVGACIWTPGEVPNESESHARKLITALVKAVREDCEKVAKDNRGNSRRQYGTGWNDACDAIADEIRGKNGR